MRAIPRLVTEDALLATVLFAGAGLCSGQGIVTGTISGRVQDPSVAAKCAANFAQDDSSIYAANFKFRTPVGHVVLLFPISPRLFVTNCTMRKVNGIFRQAISVPRVIGNWEMRGLYRLRQLVG